MDLLDENQPQPWPEGYPKTQKCKKCDRILDVVPRPDQIHHKAEVYCPEHGRMWAKGPASTKKPKRKAIHVERFPEHMRGFCWVCLRDKRLLSTLSPRIGFEVHHIIAVSDGGSDNLENLMLLCEECHLRIHRIQESFNRYAHLAETSDTVNTEPNSLF